MSANSGGSDSPADEDGLLSPFLSPAAGAAAWDCDGCPPPFFELSPPPRPPFLDDGDHCSSGSGSSHQSPYESCDNIGVPVIVVDSGLGLEGDLLNVLVIVISALVLVLLALLAACLVWR